MRATYALQPFEIGNKQSKSLAVIIPSRLVKENHLDTSTILVIRADKDSKRFTMVAIDSSEIEDKDNLSASSTLAGSGQRITETQ